MNGIPGAESRALHVERAKAAVRWATAEAIVGREVNGFAKDTWVTAVQHLLVMHALNPDAVALKAEHLITLYHILTGAGRHTRVRFRTTSCSGSDMPAPDMLMTAEKVETAPKVCVQESTEMKLKRNHGAVHLATGTVAGSKQAAAERTRVEQFWRNISPHWLEFVRTCRVGQDIDFEDFVSWVNDRALAAGVQDPWAQLIT